MTTTTLPRWPRLTAPVAAIWYAFGLSQCILAYLALANAAPILIWVAYAGACLLGIAGAIALAFAPSRAATLFGASFVAVMTYYAWLYTLGAPTAEDYGISLVVVAVTTALFWLSRRLG